MRMQNWQNTWGISTPTPPPFTHVLTNFFLFKFSRDIYSLTDTFIANTFPLYFICHFLSSRWWSRQKTFQLWEILIRWVVRGKMWLFFNIFKLILFPHLSPIFVLKLSQKKSEKQKEEVSIYKCLTLLVEWSIFSKLT